MGLVAPWGGGAIDDTGDIGGKLGRRNTDIDQKHRERCACLINGETKLQ